MMRVAVGVSVGTDAVRVAATLAVCTIKVLIVLASSVDTGIGVAMAGTQAMINAKVMNQSNGFFVGDCILSIQAKINQGVAGVRVSVGVWGGKGVRVSVGVDGIGVFVGTITTVGGTEVGVGVGKGVRVGSRVGVGRLMVNATRFSA